MKKRHSLSIFLIKDGVALSDVVKQPDGGLPDGVHVLDIVDGCISGKLYYKANVSARPKWVSLFSSSASSALDSLTTSSASAVLLVTWHERVFAFSFGYGRALLDASCWEENFGLLVVLNSIDPNRIRTLDAQSLDAIPVHIRSQAFEATGYSNFGFDAEKDLLSAAAGKPLDNRLGALIAGRDSVSLAIPFELEDCSWLLDLLLERFASKDYEDGFSWIRNLKEVKDVSAIKKMDVLLGNKIRLESASGEFDRTWLALPSIEDWTDFGGFKYQQKKKGDTFQDINWVTYLNFVRNSSKAISAKTFRDHKVLRLKDSSQDVVQKWSVYQCIYCEIDVHGQSYVLTGGKWYEVDATFMADLNDFETNVLAARMVDHQAVGLPSYSPLKDKTEGQYNSRVSETNPDRFALTDKNLIRIGKGHDRIEFCDLYSIDRQMIHVKRYGGSAVLSHLFSQGLVSAELFVSSEDFRRKVRALLAPEYSGLVPESRPVENEHEVVYAIISRGSVQRFKLPLFSKISLRNTLRRLDAFNIRVRLTIVPSVESTGNERL